MSRILRGAARAAALVVVALVVVGPATAHACDAQRRQQASRPQNGAAAAPWVIGDSTLYFSVPLLARAGLGADGQGCRTMDQGLTLLADRQRAGRLSPLTVIALGANGGAARWQLDTAVITAGPDRVIAFVTPRNDPVAARNMREAAARFPRRVILMDWVAYSAVHPEWFGDDELHVGLPGATGYARFIARRAAPLMPPTARRLRLPTATADATPCGALGTARGRARVYVLRGARRIGCRAARTLARTSPLRTTGRWSGYAWHAVHPHSPWLAVYARGGGRTLVATRAPRVRAAR